MKTIRIFISSPGDVAEERKHAERVIRELQKRYAGHVNLVPVLWEDLPLTLNTSFQLGIDAVLSAEAGIDIAVFILWSRLGSEVGPTIRKDDGSTYRSGTERELDLMLSAYNRSVEQDLEPRRPRILAYVREDNDAFQQRLQDKRDDVTQMRELLEQRQLVESFVQEVFHDSATDTNVRAYHNYERPIEYRERLRQHLQVLIDDLIQLEPTGVRWEGPPFQGLEAFGTGQALIFFGREREVADVLTQLDKRATRGCAAVIVAGASGAGKSSLVQAGIIPALIEREADDQTATWWHCSFKPGQASGGFLHELARALQSDTALPKLRDQLAVEELADALGEAPDVAWKLTLGPALATLDADRLPARLLIYVDQLEEIFTHAGGDPDSIDAFFRALRKLACTGRVRVIASVRSDFYARCQEHPDLLAMMQDGGLYDLLPPRTAALGQIITRPALLAGLRFEEDAQTGQSLDRQILDDAAKHPGVLPLLQYTLRELFEASGSRGVLTFANYQALGGVDGALGRRADAVLADLDEESRGRFGDVFHTLVTIGGDEATSVTRQQARLGQYQNDPAARRLVDRFVSERLFISDRDTADEPIVSVAHEALLHAWPVAVKWVEENRDFLADRARVQHDLDQWHRENQRNDYLIAAGKPLEDARALLASSGRRLRDEQKAYIQRSLDFHRDKQQRALRRTQLAAAVFLGLGLLASVGGVYAWLQRDRAVEAEQIAAGERDRATDALEETSRLNDELEQQLYENRIAVAERELTQNHDFDLASELLARCPEELRGWEWHYLMRLRDGRDAPLTGHKSGIWSVTYSPSGDHLLTTAIDGTARIWDAKDRTQQRVFTNHNGPVEAARGVARFRGQDVTYPDVVVKVGAYSPDGRSIATGSIFPRLGNGGVDLRNSAGTVLIWDAQSGVVQQTFDDQVGFVLDLAYSPDGRFIASSSMTPDHNFVVWEAATGAVVKRPGSHDGHVYALAYSPDGRYLLSGGIEGDIKIWDAKTLEQIDAFEAHPAPLMSIAFAPDSSEFATAGQDGTVRIWSAGTWEPRRTLRGHMGSALSVTYHPDYPEQSRIASSGFDKTVRLWDPQTGRLKITLRQHTDTVWDVAFSPDGQQLVSASYDDTAYVWDAGPRDRRRGPTEFQVKGHEERVNCLAFSPNGKVLASSSYDKQIRLWDGESGTPIGTLAGHDGAVWGLAFDADSTRLASAGWDHIVRVWDLGTMEQITEFDDPTAPVQDVVMTPDGKTVVASVWDGRVIVFDVENRRVARTIDASIMPILGIALAADGKTIATAGGDRFVTLFDLETGEKLLTLDKHHDGSLDGICFSPDGTRVVVGAWDHTASVWDVSEPSLEKDDRLLAVLEGHADRLHGVDYSPDGRFIATSSDDKTVRLWDAQTFEPYVESLVHRGPVWDVRVSPDSGRVASAAWTDSGWIRTWRVIADD
ncbi:MAG: hypothetical protein AAF916_06385 [Planctomycetota bacterium]